MKMKKLYWFTLVIVTMTGAFYIGQEVFKDYIVENSILYKKNGTSTPDDFNVNFKKLEIIVNDRTIVAHYVKALNSKALVLIYHGRGESISEWAHTQAVLAQKKYSSLVLDYTGFSTSENKLSLPELRQSSLAGYEKAQELRLKNEKVVVVAHSMGNWIFLDIVEQLSQQPDKIVFHAPPYNIRQAVVDSLKAPEFIRFVIPDDFWNTPKFIVNIKSPHTLFHSKADEVIKLSLVEEIGHELNKNGRFHILESYKHNDIYLNPESGIWDTILDVL